MTDDMRRSIVGRGARWLDAPAAVARIANVRQPTWPWLLAATLVILVLSWPIRTAQSVTVDLSWRVGLHRAAADGLRFGHDVVFTYGPLGFLSTPTPFLGPTSALVFVGSPLVYLGVIGSIVVAGFRLFPWWAALALALSLARTLPWIEPFEAGQLLVFAVGVEVLRRDRVSHPDGIAVAAGVIAGFAALGKLNVGVFAAAMALAVVLAVARPRWRGFVVLGVAAGVTTLVLWIATRQVPGDLLAYWRGSLDIISGYSEAMSVAPPNDRWVPLAFVLVAGLLAWIGSRAAVRWTTARRLALAALLVLLLVATWKYAFVRDKVEPTFATLAMAAMLLLPAPPALPRSTTVVALVAVGLAVLGVTHAPPTRYLDVVSSSRDFASQAADSLLPWRWDAAAERTRRKLRAAYPLPPTILAAIDARTVHVDPNSAAATAADPAITWRPEPVFQSYSAYTPLLDRMNADRLRSPDRPERILREFLPWRVIAGRSVPYPVDGRFYWFEAPEATLERLCRYREIAVTDRWQVLAATGRECGAPQPLGVVTAGIGEIVDVPTAPSQGDFVVVRVHGVGDSLLAKLRTAAWRSPAWSVLVDGFRYRLVPGTAADGLLLAVPSSAQGSAPFAFGDPVRTIAIRGSRMGSDGKLRYEFLAVPGPGS